MIKKQKGFSLIELVIGITVLSIISVAVGTSFTSIFSNQQNAQNQYDINGLESALKSYIATDAFCSSSLRNLRVFPRKRDLVVRNFNGFGYSGNLRKGTQVNDKIRVSSLEIKVNTVPAAVPTYHNGNRANARTVDINFNFKSRVAYKENGQLGADSSWLEKRAQSVTLPVKMIGGAIVSCDAANSPESICAATGGTWAAGKCKPKENCNFKGNFISWSCSGVRNKHVCGNTFSDKLTNRADGSITGIYTVSVAGSSNTKLIKNKTSGGVTNPRNGRLSCPSGSSKTFTGRDTATYSLDCGKKCTYIVSQTADFYSCRQCDGD